MTKNNGSIDELVQVKTNTVRERMVDTAGSVTYSLMVGSGLDYVAGLSLSGIIASRVSATVANVVTGAPYGMWRDYVFEKTNTRSECGTVRKSVVELIAFNTFQVPIYAVGIMIGTFVSEGEVNWATVQEGSEYLAMISPLIGPTMGWYMDGFRRMCGVKSAAEQVERK